MKKDEQFNYLNLDININSGLISELIIYEINKVIIINKLNFVYEIKKMQNIIFLFDEIFKKNFSQFEAYYLISINNKNNILKILPSNGDIISSTNYIITKLIDMKGIFIKVKEDDLFMIKIIPQEISKYMEEEYSTFFSNTFFDNKKYGIEFVHNIEDIYIYYNYISSNLKIYKLNSGSLFNFEDIINNKMNNFSLLSGLNTLENEKTYIIMKEANGPFLYEKYVNNLIIDFNYVLDISKIFYLFMDFEYTFTYNKKIKKILLKKINNIDKQSSLNIVCENNNLLMKVVNNIQIINLEKCNGKFTISGNNSLIYLLLPSTLNDSYTVVENENNEKNEEIFELYNTIHFFFVPTKNDYNSLNIQLNIDYKTNNYPVYLSYYIDYGMIPYSRNIEKKSILLKNETNIIIPNFSNNSNNNEKYFIYFKFNTTIAKLKTKVIYENVIYLEDKASLILKPGINIIKFLNDIDHYLNITQNNKNKQNSFCSIYKNEIIIEKHKISDKSLIIYVQEPSYNENIKIKIENEDDVLLSVSPEYFNDFSFISYYTNLDIKQIENILIVKFNATNYNSKLEYNIALIEQEDNIEPFSIHKKFYKNDFIYKNIIYSLGNEQIETNISLHSDLIYNKNYTVISYGKDVYGESFNYFYFEPKTIFITGPNNNEKEKENTNTIINTDENTNIINNPSVTDLDDDTDDFDQFGGNINGNKDKKSGISTTALILIIVASIILL